MDEVLSIMLWLLRFPVPVLLRLYKTVSSQTTLHSGNVVGYHLPSNLQILRYYLMWYGTSGLRLHSMHPLLLPLNPDADSLLLSRHLYGFYPQVRCSTHISLFPQIRHGFLQAYQTSRNISRNMMLHLLSSYSHNRLSTLRHCLRLEVASRTTL